MKTTSLIQLSVFLSFLFLLQSQVVAQSKPRSRRIIINDDGGIRFPKDGKNWDSYLNQRIRLATGTQADSYFLCVAATSLSANVLPGTASTMSQWAANGKIAAPFDQAARRIINTARSNRLEVFASVRMNDTHDRIYPGAKNLHYPLKLKRPDLLLGNARSLEIGHHAYPMASVMQWFWAGFDWKKGDVHKHFLGFIRWYCSKYDFDGLELDYYRHPCFFKIGEEEEGLAHMTKFVRQVRRTLNEIGKRRGRPYLLAIRVPDTPEICRRSGLDVETWLKEKLMDLVVVGGGYMPHSGRLKKLIDLAHRQKIPAYPCVNHFRGPVQMRSISSNFRALGADGLYLFNFSRPPGREIEKGWGKSSLISMKEIGSLKTMRGKNKVFKADVGQRRNYIGYSSLESQFPVKILSGRPTELLVGDDVAAANKAGLRPELKLVVVVANVEPKASLRIRINDVSLKAKTIARTGKATFTAKPPVSVLRRGVNKIVFAPGKNAPAHLDAQVTGMKLMVTYKK